MREFLHAAPTDEALHVSARRLSPYEEAALIGWLAAGRAKVAARHRMSCTCDACRVRRYHTELRQLRARVAEAVTS